MPGPSLTQMATAYQRPRTFWLSPHRRAAVGRHLQQAVEGMAFIVAELAEDRRQFHGALERRQDLLHVEVALRGRKPRLVLLENVARMAEARIGLLVIAPFDLAAFGGLGIAGVAHIGGVALVAQQRPADLLAGAGELVVRAEEGERMVDRHHRQVLAAISAIRRPQMPAQTTTWSALMVPRSVTTPLMRPFSTTSDLAGVLAKDFELAAGFGLVDQLAGDGLRARNDEAGIGIPQAALHHLFLDQRELLLDLGGLDQAGARAEGLGRGDLALDLVHAAIVADARDLEAADARVVAHLLVEIDRVERRPARQKIVAGRVAEVGGMRRRADVGRNAGFVDADDVVPAALDQVMGDRCADDTAEPDDDDLRFFRKPCHLSATSKWYCGHPAPV